MTQEATKRPSDGATEGGPKAAVRTPRAKASRACSPLSSPSSLRRAVPPPFPPSSLRRAVAPSLSIPLRRSVAPSLPHLRPAFTLAEIIVAIIITGFLAGATTLAISQAARARDASVARVEAHLRAETAVARIASDLQNTVRDPEVFFTRVLVTNRSVGTERDELLLYARSLKLVRPRAEQGEGGEYECQYRLEPLPPGVGPRTRSPDNPLLALWRRADPVPDEIPDGGGVAAAIVTGITSLTIRAYDGSQWFDSWDSDYSGYPHAVSVTAVATDDTGRYLSTARRIVALDRTPLPEVPVVIEEVDSTTGSGQQP